VAYLTLRLLGHEKVGNYDHAWAEWSADEFLPVEK